MERDCKRDLEICDKATKYGWEVKPVPYNLGFVDDNRNVLCVCKENGDINFLKIAREALPYYIKQCMSLEAKNHELEAQVGRMREVLIKYAGRHTADCDCIACHVLQNPAPARWEKMQKVVEESKLAVISHKYQKCCSCSAMDGLKDALAELEGCDDENS